MEGCSSEAVPPDADGLAGLVRRLGESEVVAVIESMDGPLRPRSARARGLGRADR